MHVTSKKNTQRRRYNNKTCNYDKWDFSLNGT